MMPERESEPRILIVEENEYHGLLMGRQISRRVDGSRVMIARGADEALRLARVETFDVAVVDFVLSDCDGLSLLHSLHQLAPNLSIIVVAEQITERITKEVFKQGCEELLVKDSSYYAVIPRMVAGLWQKKQPTECRQPANGHTRWSASTELGWQQLGITREIQVCLDEIFRATSHVLKASDVNDNDLTRRIKEIEEWATKIKLSLEKNIPPAVDELKPGDWTTVSGDKSASYAVK